MKAMQMTQCTKCRFYCSRHTV